MTRARNSASYQPEMLELLRTIGLSQDRVLLPFANVKDALDLRNKFYGLRNALGREKYFDVDLCLAVRFRLEGTNLVVEGAHKAHKSSIENALQSAVTELREKGHTDNIANTKKEAANIDTTDYGITAQGEASSVPAPRAGHDAIAAYMASGKKLLDQLADSEVVEVVEVTVLPIVNATESDDDVLLDAVANAGNKPLDITVLPEHLRLLFVPPVEKDAK